MTTTTRADAEATLQRILAGGGTVPLADLHRVAEESGIPWRIFQIVKMRMHIQSVKSGFPGAVVGWALPDDYAPHVAEVPEEAPKEAKKIQEQAARPLSARTVRAACLLQKLLEEGVTPLGQLRKSFRESRVLWTSVLRAKKLLRVRSIYGKGYPTTVVGWVLPPDHVPYVRPPFDHRAAERQRDRAARIRGRRYGRGLEEQKLVEALEKQRKKKFKQGIAKFERERGELDSRTLKEK